MNVVNSKWFSSGMCDQKRALEVERINEAIAEVIFNQDVAGIPVYLDLNLEEISSICRIIGVDPSGFERHLCDAVLNIPKAHGWKKVFEEFNWAAEKWSNAHTPMEVPPTLALLAVLSMAAEEMASETDISGANYYTRLSTLFECPGKELDIGIRYRKHAIQIWSTLRDWLGAWEGERGLSTVPIPKVSSQDVRDFKWAIQMPISQARLRDADRQDLHRMFDQYGLDPVSNISIDVMSIFLENWCTSPYCTKNFKRIWKIVDYRETLAAAAISELRTWTGQPTNDQGFGVRLLLSVSRSIRLGTRFKFNIELRCDPALEIRQVSLDIGSNISKVCDVFPVVRGRFRLVDPELFEPGSMISRPLKMSISGSGVKGERKPRQVIPMRLDEQQQYVEVDTLSTEGTFGILMLENIHGRQDLNLRKQCEEILNEIARPGWSVISPIDEGAHGLPEGWLFIRDVEVMTVSSSKKPIYAALNVLLPQAMPSLQFSRGLRIPGQQERWLVSQVPELKIIYPADEIISILLADSHEQTIKEFHLKQRAGVISLSDLSLAAGRYQITMKLQNGTVVGNKLLTLVDAATPNAWSALKAVFFCYQVGDSSSPSAMTAVSTSAVSSGNMLRGFYYEGTAPMAGLEVDPPSLAPWNQQFVIDSAEEDLKRSQVSIKTEDPTSCFYTGAHYFKISEIHWGVRPPRGILNMRCETCGVSKVQSAIPVYLWNRKPATPKSGSTSEHLRPLNFQIVPRVPLQSLGKWDFAYEAMCYLRHGKSSDIETILNQLASDEDFNAERFMHGSQILGLVDLSLDEYFRLKEWSISPACVVMTSETSGFLSGFRSADLLEKIESQITLVGGSLKQIKNKDLPSSWIFEVLNPEAISQSLNGILDPVTKLPIRIVRHVAETIAHGVGSISQLFKVSPKISVPPYIRLKRWDHWQTKWVTTDNARLAGAIQYDGYGNKYTYSDVDVEIDGLVTSGSVRTVKHKVAQAANSPLVYYSDVDKQFYARLGAELPGLFGRALVASSGLAPREDLVQRVVVYSGIEPQLARLVFGQLMS